MGIDQRNVRSICSPVSAALSGGICETFQISCQPRYGNAVEQRPVIIDPRTTNAAT